MTLTIISICILLLLAYVFDITSAKTKIPSVVLLLILGWGVKQISDYFGLFIPDLTEILPFLGSIGLILIVLEGSLELELNKEKLPFVWKSALIALIPMVILSLGLGLAFQYFGETSFKNGLANAIPFAVISSAIAIPSAKNLMAKNREFITYESSLSDIFGVVFFNFITLNDNIGTTSVGFFILELFLILIVTFGATLGLALLLSNIRHHVKFIPIVLFIILIYEVSKEFNLPALIFILLFGLFLGNLDELKQFDLIKKLKPDILNNEVHKFQELTTEIAFLIRALFFLLFGYLIQTNELLNPDSVIWAAAITLGIFGLRYLFLRIFGMPIMPLVYIAPRGLITILLFLSIPINQTTYLANNSLVIQVIILSALVMMVGLISYKQKPEMLVQDPLMTEKAVQDGHFDPIPSLDE